VLAGLCREGEPEEGDPDIGVAGQFFGVEQRAIEEEAEDKLEQHGNAHDEEEEEGHALL